MNIFRIIPRVAVVCALLFAMTLMADAQATRTWVSGVGDDVNPCSRTAPCKTFAGAISKTATDGVINCLDPGGFGTVNITKSITIDCTGTLGGVLSANTNGVIVNITSSTDVRKAVILRGLNIDGAGDGVNGIRILAATSVDIENTVLEGFTQHGISIETNSGNPRITVANTTIRGAFGNGINTFIGSGTVYLSVSNSKISGTTTGVNLTNNTKADISGSNVTGNATGLVAYNADMGVANCSVSNNGAGVSAASGGTIRLTGNMITGNTNGLVNNGGNIISFGSNVLNGNDTNGSPTSTVTLL